MREAVIVYMDGNTSLVGPKGSLRYTRPEDLAAQVVEGVLKKVPQLKSEEIDDFVLGCSFPEATRVQSSKNSSAKSGDTKYSFWTNC